MLVAAPSLFDTSYPSHRRSRKKENLGHFLSPDEGGPAAPHRVPLRCHRNALTSASPKSSRRSVQSYIITHLISLLLIIHHLSGSILPTRVEQQQHSHITTRRYISQHLVASCILVAWTKTDGSTDRMHDYNDYGQVSHDLASFSVDTGSVGEQYEVDLSNSQNGWCTATNCAEGVQCCPQSYHSHGHRSAEGHPQMTSRYQVPSHMEPYQDSKFQDDTFPEPYGQASSLVRSDHIDPALLTAHEPLYDQTLNFDNDDGQVYGYGNHPGQLTDISVYVRCQQESPLSTCNISNGLSYTGNQDIDLRPGYGEGGEDQTHHLSMVSQNVGENDLMSKPQDVFVAGVLDRSDNHRTTLEAYTNKLVGQTGVSTSNTYIQQDHTIIGSFDLGLHLDRIESGQAAIVSPTSLQDVHGHQGLDDRVEGQLIDRPMPTGFQYFVKEGSPLFSDLDISESRSR